MLYSYLCGHLSLLSYLFILLFIYLSLCLLNYLSIYLTVYLSILVSPSLSICLAFYLMLFAALIHVFFPTTSGNLCSSPPSPGMCVALRGVGRGGAGQGRGGGGGGGAVPPGSRGHRRVGARGGGAGLSCLIIQVSCACCVAINKNAPNKIPRTLQPSPQPYHFADTQCPEARGDSCPRT